MCQNQLRQYDSKKSTYRGEKRYFNKSVINKDAKKRACLLEGQFRPSTYTFLNRQSHFSHLSEKSFAQTKEMTFDRRLKTLGLQLFSVYITPPLKI